MYVQNECHGDDALLWCQKRYSRGDSVGDMIPSDKNDATESPAIDKHNPKGRLEPGLVVIDCGNTDCPFCRLPAEMNQKSRNNVLDSSSGITTSHSHQEFDARCSESYADRRNKSKKRKETVPGIPRVSSTCKEQKNFDLNFLEKNLMKNYYYYYFLKKAFQMK